MEGSTVKTTVIAIFVFLLLASIVTDDETILTFVIMCFIIISPFGVAWYMNEASEMHRLREKIKNYKPGRWTIKDVGDGFMGPSKIRLGVYGDQGSGKSALLNSIHFAYTGEWRHNYVEKEMIADRGETLFRDPVMLTDYITTFDTRGLADFSVPKVDDVMAEIRGERGIDTRSMLEGEKIDCPIFVFGWSPIAGIRQCHDFLVSFLPRIRELLGAYPIMVITFAESIVDRELVLQDIIAAGMDKTSVFFLENYTVDNHEMNKERHITLLKILGACILRADDNITFKWRKQREDRTRPSWLARMLRKIMNIFKRRV